MTTNTTSNVKTPRILIFDSGVGGLSVTEEIIRQHPYCSIIYASDNAAFPYGTKAEGELVERVDTVLHQLQQASQADIIVVACNTASTVALPKIRERFDQPVVGVVPAIKPAARISETKVIGLLATLGTVNRKYTQQLVSEFASHCSVIPVGSNELVAMAEDHLRNKGVSREKLLSIVKPLIDQPELDTVVLACTHFPLLKKELISVLPNVKYWVDSGEAIARRVGYWLDELGLMPSQELKDNIKHRSFFTAEDSKIEELQEALNQRMLGNIEFITN